MKNTVLREIANEIEGLALFDESKSNYTLQDKISFYGGFIGVIADNNDLSKLIEDQHPVAQRAFSESLKELDSMIGPDSRSNLYSKNVGFTEKGSFAARILVARFNFKLVELDLVSIHDDFKETGFKNLSEDAAQVASAVIKDAKTVPSAQSAAATAVANRPKRNIDPMTGKTGDKLSPEAGLKPKDQSEGEQYPAVQKNTEQRAVNLLADSQKKSLSGDECLSLLEAADKAISEATHDSKGAVEKNQSQGVAQALSGQDALKALKAKFSAQASEGGANFIKSISPSGQ